MLTVSICQCSRNEPDLRGIELENGARSDKNWPASISNRRRRRRKKTRKTKTRDPDVTINLESEEIEAEEVESFEEDIQPLRMDGVGTGGGSRIEQQHVDVPKVSGLCRILFCCGVQQLHLLRSIFRLFISFANTSSSSSYPFAPFTYSQRDANQKTPALVHLEPWFERLFHRLLWCAVFFFGRLCVNVIQAISHSKAELYFLEVRSDVSAF